MLSARYSGSRPRLSRYVAQTARTCTLWTSSGTERAPDLGRLRHAQSVVSTGRPTCASCSAHGQVLPHAGVDQGQFGCRDTGRGPAQGDAPEGSISLESAGSAGARQRLRTTFASKPGVGTRARVARSAVSSLHWTRTASSRWHNCASSNAPRSSICWAHPGPEKVTWPVLFASRRSRPVKACTSPPWPRSSPRSSRPNAMAICPQGCASCPDPRCSSSMKSAVRHEAPRDRVGRETHPALLPQRREARDRGDAGMRIEPEAVLTM